jgi:hypothetical protein
MQGMGEVEHNLSYLEEQMSTENKNIPGKKLLGCLGSLLFFILFLILLALYGLGFFGTWTPWGATESFPP